MKMGQIVAWEMAALYGHTGEFFGGQEQWSFYVEHYLAANSVMDGKHAIFLFVIGPRAYSYWADFLCQKSLGIRHVHLQMRMCWLADVNIYQHLLRFIVPKKKKEEKIKHKERKTTCSNNFQIRQKLHLTLITTYQAVGSGNVLRNHSANTGGCLWNNICITILIPHSVL